MKGKASASETRTGASKCSSSSSTSWRLLCGCGEEKEITCNYFCWADDEKTEKSSSLDEVEASFPKEDDEWKKKL
ncbi:hypothetical protein SESBI_05612 [Sesbania bispinosa]|nr:hypothetical protein SESBI_05612 [Sesbania bispinosa]